MPDRKTTGRLSAGELEIMAMLWDGGPLTLAEAHCRFGRYGKPVGYTTVQTRLNRLVQKRLAARDDGRPAKYRAAVSAEAVGRRHLDLLLEKVSGGSVVPLVAHLISGQKLSADEIRELKRLVADAGRAARSNTRKRKGKP